MMKAMLIKDKYALEWSMSLVGFITPMFLAAPICAFLLTSAKLPPWRLSWVHQVIQTLRPFRNGDYGRDLAKKNQFGLGDSNFNMISLFLIGMPGLYQFAGYLHNSLAYAANEETDSQGPVLERKVRAASYLSGWAATMVLIWFLIPVARHSVLLTAMGWSPTQALRIHIWAGYLSFIYAVVHSVLEPVQWIFWGDVVWYRHFIPPAGCWAYHSAFPGTHDHHDEAIVNATNVTNATALVDDAPVENEEESPEDDYKDRCALQFYNLTGILAMLFFLVLWGSSLHWFRRRNYRRFYILHVVFGSLMLLFTVLHVSKRDIVP
jgi:hypothetical protein